LKKINTILFDLDGTLVNSNEIIIESYKQTLKEFQPEKTYSRKQIIDLIGPPLKTIFYDIYPDDQKVAEMIQFYRSFYQKHEFEYIHLYDNIIETLEKLKERNINLGIVTTKFKESAMPSIKRFGIDKFIDEYCFLGTVKEHKPSPIPIFYVLNKFKNTNSALMIGDNPSDILAGKNANILTCGLEWALSKDKLLNTKPDYWLNDYLELINIVDEVN
jgi:pyrophosphatase PpaX